MADVQAKFQAAVDVIHSLPKNGSYKPSPQMMLQFYSYYKQATEGKCNRSKPWSFDVVNKAKWDAWNKLGDMTKEEAMERYVTDLTKIIEALPATDQAADFVQTLGHFYEVVDAQSNELTQLKNFSREKGYSPHHKVNGSPPQHSKSNGKHFQNQEDDLGKVNGVSSNGIDHNSASEHQNEIEENSNELNVNANDEKDNFKTFKSDELQGDQANESDDEFCDTTAVILPSPLRYRDDSGSQSAPSSLSTTSLSGSPSQHTPSRPTLDVSQSRREVPLLRGGQKGTHGIDEPIQFSHGASEHRKHTEPSFATNLLRTPVSAGAGGGGGERNPAEDNRQSEVQERIAIALLQLQRDMHSVLNRLTTLETITISRQQDLQHRHHCCIHGSERTASSWRFFDDLSPRTTLFVLLWPFLAQFLISMWRRSKLRRHR